ncbi:MAG: amidohydrolase [Synergistaceae bacterium]|jgi:amidohydrolase|nr:amidohydrolase [Synergistaceae bacterium]
MDVKERAKALNPEMVEWRRQLHSNPELSLELPWTEAFIAGELEKLGVEKIQKGVGGHGVVGLIEGKKPGKVLGIRADMDALKVQEDTGLSFASKNGWMHACGHDAHMAMLLGAAAMLMESRDQLQGTIKLIFQPSEEDGRGAPAMIKDGVLENPKVDAILGLHTGGLWEGAVAGEIGYCSGPMMASSDWFTVTFTGKGGHGATPHVTVDPISIACHVYSVVQTIVSRETSPLHPALVTVASIHAGTTNNVIPPTAVMEGTFRALTPETRQFLRDRFKQICEEVAHAMRGTAKVEYRYAPPPVINDPAMTEKLRKAAAALLGEDHVHPIKEPTMGAEDMAFFMEKVPGTFFFHPSFRTDGSSFPHHHPKFDIDESVLWVGAGTFVQFALCWQN